MTVIRYAALLACSLSVSGSPVAALESRDDSAAVESYYAHQRDLLEAYVACIQDPRLRDLDTGATACASARSAYAATLPEDAAVQILRDVDRAARPSSGR